jgi:hypothetical protein
VRNDIENRPITRESNYIYDETREANNYEYNEVVQPREGLEARRHFWKVNVN